MSQEFEKNGPGTDNKAFVPEDEAKTKSFDSMVNEKIEHSDYTGYGFKEVLLKIIKFLWFYKKFTLKIIFSTNKLQSKMPLTILGLE